MGEAEVLALTRKRGRRWARGCRRRGPRAWAARCAALRIGGATVLGRHVDLISWRSGRECGTGHAGLDAWGDQQRGSGRHGVRCCAVRTWRTGETVASVDPLSANGQRLRGDNFGTLHDRRWRHSLPGSAYAQFGRLPGARAPRAVRLPRSDGFCEVRAGAAAGAGRAEPGMRNIRGGGGTPGRRAARGTAPPFCRRLPGSGLCDLLTCPGGRPKVPRKVVRQWESRSCRTGDGTAVAALVRSVGGEQSVSAHYRVRSPRSRG